MRPRYRVTFDRPYGCRFIIEVDAEDAGSAQLLGLARLSVACGGDQDAVEEWTWTDTHRLSPSEEA